MYHPQWEFPLPIRLPTELKVLQSDSSLLADVWVTRVSAVVPPWLADTDVRRGIRAILAKDRCLEERRRLGREADNLCRWYGHQLAAVELAMRLPQSKDLSCEPCYIRLNMVGQDAAVLFLLKQQKEELLLLRFRWRTPLVSDIRFQSQTTQAIQTAERLSGTSSSVSMHWVYLNVEEDEADEAWQTDDPIADDESCLVHDTLECISELQATSDYLEADFSATSELEAMSDELLAEPEMWISQHNPVSKAAKPCPSIS